MLPVILRGALGDISGYGSFCRYIARALHSAGIRPAIFDLRCEKFSPYVPSSNEERAVLDELRAVKLPDPAEALVIDATPPDLFSHCYKADVGYSMTECTHVPASWVMSCLKMDAMFVPGPFNKGAFEHFGVLKVAEVAPGFDTGAYRWVPEDRFGVWGGIGPEPFKFIVTGHLMQSEQDRKGIKQLIRCWVREFPKDPDVGLALKIQVYSHDFVDRLELTGILCGLLEKEGAPQMIGRISVLHRNYTNAELATVYSHPSIRAFVSPTCLLPDETVVTKEGLKKIREINIGDRVLSESGNYHPVEKVTAKTYSGEILRIKANGLPWARLTPEHEIYAIPCRGWDNKKTVTGHNRKSKARDDIVLVRAGELKKYDYVVYPVPRTTGNIRVLRTERYSSKRFKRGSRKRAHDLPSEILLDKDFGLLCGLYVSEGCHTGDGVNYSFSTKERNYYEWVKDQFEGRFKTKAKIIHRDRNRTQVIVYGRQFSSMFSDLFGFNSHNKKLPSWILDAPLEFRGAVIEGIWRGDGSQNIDCPGRKTDELQTVSEQLAYQVFNLLVAEGFRPTLAKQQRQSVVWRIRINGNQGFRRFLCMEDPDVSRKSNSIIWSDGKHLFYPVSKITKETHDGLVYDLTVSEEHNFTGNFLLKNCGEGIGYNMIECASCGGVPVIATGFSEHVNFIPPDLFVGLPFTLVPIPDEYAAITHSPFSRDAFWASVSDGDLMGAMRKFYESESGRPRRPVAGEIMPGLSLAAFGKRLADALEAVVPGSRMRQWSDKIQVGSGINPVDGWIHIEKEGMKSREVDIECDPKRVPLPDGLISEAMVYSILDRMTDEEAARAVYECFRMLRPGGVVHLVVTDSEKIMREILENEAAMTPHLFNYLANFLTDNVNLWTRRRLLKLLSRVGFDRAEMEGPDSQGRPSDEVAGKLADGEFRISMVARAVKP